MAISGTVSAKLSIKQTKNLGTTAVAAADTDIESKWRIIDGTDVDEADVIYSVEKTLSNAVSEELDLNGILEDIYGDAANFARIKGIFVNIKVGAARIIVGGAASNAYLSLFGDVTDKVIVEGTLLVFSRRQDSYPVTLATADILRFEHDASDGADVVYDLVIWGASA